MKLQDKDKIQQVLEEVLKNIDTLDLEDDEVVLEGLDIEAEDMSFEISPEAVTQIAPQLASSAAAGEVEVEEYEPKIKEWENQIQEVQMGATSSEG